MPRTSSLFHTTVDAKHLDNWFVGIRDLGDFSEAKAYLESAWSKVARAMDPNFHDQFQRRARFQERAWELHLAATLSSQGHALRASRSGAPDITIVRDGREIHFEATTPAPSEPLLANYRQAIDSVGGFPEAEMIRRATGAIENKRTQYRDFIARKKVQVGDPYVIALSAAAIPLGTMEAAIPWIVKPLFGLGEFYWTVPVGGGEEGHAGFFSQEQRETRTGAAIDAALFADSRAAEISAVIFNAQPAAAMSAGGDEGWLLVPNPYARNRLPSDILANARSRFENSEIARSLATRPAVPGACPSPD